jgi:uncharacterized OB-fold protein
MMGEEKKMVVYKCKKCGRINYPKRARCLSCRGKEFDGVEIMETGKIITYTQVYNMPEGIRVDSPLILGIAEFPTGFRAMGQIDIDPWMLKTGIEVKPVWDKLREVGGKEVYGFKFIPVKSKIR